MDKKDNYKVDVSGFDEIRKEFYKYLYFWPVFLISILSFSILAYSYLRYSEYNYESTSKIEIIDKSQDSEMALPTAMTIFNRSMINLENEIGVLKSKSIHSKVVSELNFNLSYYTFGLIKTSQNHPSEWFAEYKLTLKANINDSNYKVFDFEIDNNILKISIIDLQNEDVIKTFEFSDLTTLGVKHDLPFDITIVNSSNLLKRRLVVNSFRNTVEYFSQIVKVAPSGKDSDQLTLSLLYPNTLLAEEYLNTLIKVFDYDGVKDRQIEYQRTMDFVDSRAVYLQKELESVENKKQIFKENNNLNDIITDAQINSSQRLSYDTELFNAKSQKDLLMLLNNELDFGSNEYKLLPINIGLENTNINTSIVAYNQIAKERSRYINSAGPNNLFLKSLNAQLDELLISLKTSIVNYTKSLDLTISNLTSKEEEFLSFSNNIPNNEKILRSIERELEVKESLFLLLLQKREEAAINLAVVKPSIKIIDYASSSKTPTSPKPIQIYLGAFAIGFLLPIIFIYLWFVFDDKIHSRDQINSVSDVPIIAEIPEIKNLNNLDILSDITNNSRTVLNESVRMAIANLKYFLFESNPKTNKTILVTSSIKGEGKTLFSVLISKILSLNTKKVLLIGADLRNPQIHKFLNLDRQKISGLSEYIYRNDLKISDLLIKNDNLDILLSGSIPPNPSELLQSERFKNELEALKKQYDIIVIDSAPCLLVSDTLIISDYVDASICMVRANHTKKEILSFLKEVKEKGLLKNLSIVLNGVGSNTIYGYKYSYSYKYSYGYNYGYGYGYGADNK